MADKFGEGLGIWAVKVGGSNFELKPTMADVRDFRNLLMDFSNKKKELFNRFSEFMYGLIKKQHPDDPEERIREFIECNCINLFNEAMIKFRFTTREKLAEAEKEAMGDLKKLTGND